jgi:hypothetical protein
MLLPRHQRRSVFSSTRWPATLAILCARGRCLNGGTELTRLREKLSKTCAKVVSHGCYVTFQIAEVAVLREMFAEILMLIARLRAPSAPA